MTKFKSTLQSYGISFPNFELLIRGVGLSVNARVNSKDELQQCMLTQM